MHTLLVFVIASTAVSSMLSRIWLDAVLKSSNMITLKRRPTRTGSDNKTEFVEMLEGGAYVTDRRRLPGSIC